MMGRETWILSIISAAPPLPVSENSWEHMGEVDTTTQFGCDNVRRRVMMDNTFNGCGCNPRALDLCFDSLSVEKRVGKAERARMVIITLLSLIPFKSLFNCLFSFCLPFASDREVLFSTGRRHPWFSLCELHFNCRRELFMSHPQEHLEWNNLMKRLNWRNNILDERLRFINSSVSRVMVMWCCYCGIILLVSWCECLIIFHQETSSRCLV